MQELDIRRASLEQPCSLLPISGGLVKMLLVAPTVFCPSTHTQHLLRTRLYQLQKQTGAPHVALGVRIPVHCCDNRAANVSPLIGNDSSYFFLNRCDRRQPLAMCPSAPCFSGSAEASRRVCSQHTLTGVGKSPCRCSAATSPFLWSRSKV